MTSALLLLHATCDKMRSHAPAWLRGAQERQQQGAQGKAAEPAPRASAARAQSAALLDTVFPVEPMAVPLGSLLAAEAV